MAVVFIPAQLRTLTAGVKQVNVRAETVGQAIEELEAIHPGIRERLCVEGELAPGLQVSIDHAISSRGVRGRLNDDSEVHFLPAIGGG